MLHAHCGLCYQNCPSKSLHLCELVVYFWNQCILLTLHHCFEVFCVSWLHLPLLSLGSRLESLLTSALAWGAFWSMWPHLEQAWCCSLLLCLFCLVSWVLVGLCNSRHHCWWVLLAIHELVELVCKSSLSWTIDGLAPMSRSWSTYTSPPVACDASGPWLFLVLEAYSAAQRKWLALVVAQHIGEDWSARILVANMFHFCNVSSMYLKGFACSFTSLAYSTYCAAYWCTGP